MLIEGRGWARVVAPQSSDGEGNGDDDTICFPVQGAYCNVRKVVLTAAPVRWVTHLGFEPRAPGTSPYTSCRLGALRRPLSEGWPTSCLFQCESI